MKKILILNASHVEEPAIRILKQLGCYVITTGNRPDFSGHKLADKYIFADYSNRELILKIAKDNNIDAICPNGNDFGVETAAYVAEKLGLAGHDSYATTMILHNKNRFKDFAKNLGGIDTPEAISFYSENDALEWAGTVENYPLIVKPVDFFGGRGINRADNKTELTDNIHIAFSKSKSKSVVIEPFITGNLCSISTFLYNKKVVVFCTDNEFCFSNPYRVECSCFPAYDIDNKAGISLIPQIEHLAEALDLTDGIFHVQYIVNNGKAQMIECMRRILGNLFCIAAGECTKGFDWYYWQIRAKCGMGCDDIPTDIQQSNFTSYKVIRAETVGIIDELCIPDHWAKHIRTVKRLLDDGYKITDCEADIVAIIQLSFISAEQMHEYMVERKDEIKVVMHDKCM